MGNSQREMHHFPTHPVSFQLDFFKAHRVKGWILGHGKASSPAIYLRLHFIPTFWPENVQKAVLKRAHMSVLQMSKENSCLPPVPVVSALSYVTVLLPPLSSWWVASWHHGLFRPICLTAQADPNITRWLAGELYTCYSCFSPTGLDTENSGPPMSLIS